MGKRILAWLLCVAMIVSLVPASVFAEGAAITQSPKAGTHQATGHTCDDAGCGETNWQPWPTDGSRPTNGHYYLTGNVQLEGMVSVKAGEKLHVCLNGFVMTAAPNKRHMSSSEAGAEIVITDCTAYTDENGVYQAGALTGGVNTGKSGAGAVYVATNAVLKLYNGRITGNISKHDDAKGGAIVLGAKSSSASGARFYMYNGEISNNAAYMANGEDHQLAGAIYVNNGAAAEITGGTIRNNTGASGGAAYVRGGGVLTVANTKLIGNVSKADDGVGGTVALEEKSNSVPGGILRMTGGEISDSASYKANGKDLRLGGAVYVGEGATAEITGATIKDNTGSSGGAIYVKGGGSLTVADAELTGNTGTNGAAIYGTGTGEITIKDSVITGNTGTSTNAAGRCAAVYTDGSGSKVTLSGKVVIVDNNVAVAGTPGLVMSATKAHTVYVKDLEDGSRVDFRTSGFEPTEASQVLMLDTQQTEPWQSGWIKYYSKSGAEMDVGLVNGQFVFGHYHGTQEYTKLENAAQLEAAGHYYLAGDLKLDAKAELKTKNMAVDVCLNGHSLTPADGAQLLEITGARNILLTFDDCTAYTGADGVYHAGQLTGADSGEKGGLMKVGTTAVVTLKEGKITNNKGTSGGAMILNGTFVLEGGEISNNRSTANGGAVYVNSTGVFRMTGGVVKNNQGVNGGAVYSGGMVEITGGKLTDNTATENGGAISLKSGVLKDVTITGNTAQGGAVALTASTGALELAGATNITGNTAGNLYLPKSFPGVSVTNLTGNVGVTMAADRINADQLHITGTLADGVDPSGRFTSDDNGYDVELKNKQVVLTKKSQTPPVEPKPEHEHCLCGKSVCTEHTMVEYQPWTKNDELPTSGNYYLKVDVTISSRAGLKENEELNLCLNGHTITTTDKRAFYLYKNAKLRISDCGTNPGKITGATSGAIVADSSCDGALIELYGGILTGNENTSTGGAVLAMGKTTFNMYGGTITGNALHCKLSLDAQGNPKLDKEGAQSVTSKRGGGAVGVYNADAAFYMYGGEISGNETTKVTYLDKDGKRVEAGGNGGAVFVEKGTAYLYGGKITGNTADRNGGAVYATEGGSITVGGTIQITGNTVGGEANNLQVPEGKKLKIEKLDKAAKIGVNAAEPGQFTESCDNYTENFVSDNAKRYVVYQKGALYLLAVSNHKHCFCNGASDQCKHETVTYAEWSNPKKLPTSGNYYLSVDVTVSDRAGLKGNSELNLCLNGHTITTTDKRAFYLYDSATLRISDCATTPGKITGATSGAIVSDSSCDGALIELYGGILTGNENTSTGGAVLVMGKTTFKMYGGTITKNALHCKLALDDQGKPMLDKDGAQKVTSTRGGGAVCVYNADSAFYMYGGEISGNETTKVTYLDKDGKSVETGGNGGAVFVEKGTAYLYGGKVTGNKADRYGGAVYGIEDASITLGGTIQITGNTAGGEANNLQIPEGKKLKVEKLDKTAKIGVNAADLGKFTESCDDYTENFVSDNAKRYVVYQKGALYLMAFSNHKHCFCNGASDQCKHETVTYAEWTNPKALPTSGNYYLAVDVTVSTRAGLKLDDELNLCLNGHTITTKDKRAFYMYDNAVLRISDCAKTCGKVTGATSGAIVADGTCDGALIELYKGILTGNENTSAGGAVLVQGNTTFNMYGGTITGNAVHSKLVVDDEGKPVLDEDGAQTITSNRGGGGVGLNGKKVVFHLYDGKITENQTTKVLYLDKNGKETNGGGYGGGIFCDRAAIYIHGGEVSGNTTDRTAGGIFVQNAGQVHISGGKVTGNACGASGGGLYISSNCIGSISGGEISGNSAKNSGGFHANTGAKITMTGGKVTGNTTTSSGAGIVLSGKGVEMNFTGGEVSANSGASAGGILVQNRATLNLKGGKIINNKAKNSGGGIYISTSSFLNMSDGVISGNQAKSDGGGATLVRCEAKITGGTISNNHTEVSGGGIRVTGSKLTASGLRMVGNTAAKHGGAIVTGSSSQTQNGVKVPYYVTVNLYNCYFANNTCGSSGGAMLVQSKGTVFNMTNCNFTGNEATSGGGAFYISTNVTFSMKGGKITDNYAAAGGAVRLNNCKANFVDVLIQNNEAKNGGGIYSKGENCIWSATNVQILDNKLLNGSAGGIYINAATVELNNVKVSGNESPEKSGGGIYMTGRAKLTMNGGEVSKNSCETLGGGIYAAQHSYADFIDVDFLYNHNEGDGGAVNCRNSMTFTGCKFVGNTSNGNGGAIATNMCASQWVQDLGGAFLTDCEFTDNSCAMQGGALYIDRGGPAYLTNVTLTKNKADLEGGAIYADGIMELNDVTVEENTSGGTGYALYIGPGEWDGHSYTTGRRKLIGDVIIQNNDGGDMYLAEGAVATVYGATLGDKAVINVTLCDGVLTQRIIGIYHYEGEGLNYTLTAGDRSITEPMAPEHDAADADDASAGENVLLYVCIGVFTVAVAAVAVLLALKKKKAGIPAEEASKE